MKRKSLCLFLLVLTVLFSACSFPLSGAFASESSLKCEIAVLYPTEAEDLTVSVGETIRVNWSVSGGTPPYIMEYSWKTSDGDGNWATYPEDEINGTASFTPDTGGWAYFYAEVRDAKWNWTYLYSEPVLVKDKKEPVVNYTDKMLNDKVAQVASACMTAVSGEYSRAKWLHDWLIENARYDYTFTYYSPKGVLLAGKGVCQSFAEAYQLLLNKVGISNKLVSGEANNGTWGGHAWNLVNIGGSWYHVDVTWDDTGDHYEYFLKSDQFMSKNHRWSASRYPACPYDWGKAPAGNVVPGDANNDGTVDIMDLVSIIDHIVSNTAPASPTNADANGDGVVDILDLVWIIDRIVGG